MTTSHGNHGRSDRRESGAGVAASPVPEKTLGLMGNIPYLQVDNDTPLCHHFSPVYP